MKLIRKDIIDVLIAALKETQQDIADEPELIHEETVPIGELSEFDSLTSVEVTVNVLDALGFKEFPAYPSLFISKDNKALKLGQVADRILKLESKCK